MILPLQGDALMGAVTPRALPWAKRSLPFLSPLRSERLRVGDGTSGMSVPEGRAQAAKRSLHVRSTLPAASPPYPTRSVLTRPKALTRADRLLTRADRLLTRGITALPDAQRPYTAEGPYPSRQAPYPRLCRLARRAASLHDRRSLLAGSFKPETRNQKLETLT